MIVYPKKTVFTVNSGYCHASGQFIGYGADEKIGEVHPCELCGKSLRITSHFGDSGFPKWPLHKLPIRD